VEAFSVAHSRIFIARGLRASLATALLAALCPAEALLAQEVYKSVDAQGHVVYSDRGSSKDAAKTSVRVEQPDPAEVARIAREQQTLKAADQERSKEQAAEDKTKAADDRRKKSACDTAKNQYFRLRDLNRIYQRDADGNRMYLSDEDADKMRDQARRAMNDACGG
jgi:hypothetical protein